MRADPAGGVRHTLERRVDGIGSPEVLDALDRRLVDEALVATRLYYENRIVR